MYLIRLAHLAGISFGGIEPRSGENMFYSYTRGSPGVIRETILVSLTFPEIYCD